MPIIPSIGFAGLGQMDRATQTTFAKAMGRVGGVRSARRRKKAVAAGGAKRRRRRSTRSGGKFTKGSAAAKRHMAKLRKMRRK